MSKRNYKNNKGAESSTVKRSNNRNSGKGKHWNSKSGKSNSYKKPDEREVSDDKSKRNDPAWYGSGSELNKDVSSLFFTNPSGNPIRLLDTGVESELGLTSDQYDYASAGMLTLYTVPAFGPEGGANAPINIAAQAMYAFIRSANSGARNYDANDLMTYILAVAEAFSCIMALERIYGVTRRFVPQNRYYPRTVLEQLHADYDSVSADYLRFAAGINLLISKLGAFAVPGDMDYFKRKVFMYRDVFIESENVKDQLYAFAPAGFYKYTVDSAHPEAYLKYMPWPNSNASIDDMLIYAQDLISELWTSEDAAIVCGDIIKAYGSNIIQLVTMPSEYISLPVVMDDNLRYQIRNATVVNDYNTPDLHQDAAKQFLEYDPMVIAAGTAFNTSVATANILLANSPTLLTSNKVTPNNDDVMESTRLMCMVENPDIASDGTVVGDLVCGTEVVVYYSCCVLRKNRNTNAITVRSVNITAKHSSLGGNAALIGQFHYHPLVYQWSSNPHTAASVFAGVMGGIETTTTLLPDRLFNLHEVAIMEMLAMPSISLLK